MTLAEHHEKMLIVESGIARDVAEARGYRTIEKKVELKTLGFADRQCNPPGLLIPIYSPRVRSSIISSGPTSPASARTASRSSTRLPGAPAWPSTSILRTREMLGNPLIPLFLTEGVKKGDALVSCDRCAIALLGVWNWRGRNGDGGLTALSEWEHVALNNGRRVFIIFDSDVTLKPSVHKALTRLKTFLEGR